MYLTILTILLGFCSHVTSGIFCYVCESVRDFRCLDPFDFQPFPQVDCSTLSFVRDKVPVFCEKRTEVFNGDHMTTRGYSVYYRYYCCKTRLFLCIYKISPFHILFQKSMIDCPGNSAIGPLFSLIS